MGEEDEVVYVPCTSTKVLSKCPLYRGQTRLQTSAVRHTCSHQLTQAPDRRRMHGGEGGATDEKTRLTFESCVASEGRRCTRASLAEHGCTK